MRIDGILLAAYAELARATEGHPTWPNDPQHAMAILNEEVGELARAVNQAADNTGPRSAVREEAIQVVAMALRFAASLDVYEYREAAQHVQPGWRIEIQAGPQ